MRCFYVPREQISNKKIQIEGTEFHHLKNVLRLKVGDTITVLDGSGGIYGALILSLSNNPSCAICEIKESRQIQPSEVQVTIFQGLPKAEKMDLIIQKATELGVYHIVPVMCRNSIPSPSPQRVNRWRQIAIEASKQSHRAFFPVIHDIINFHESLCKLSADLKLIFVAPSLTFVRAKWFKEVMKENASAKKIAIFIGPEGDFTQDEIQKALSIDAIPVLLSSNILRTETASISALAIVLYEQEKFL